MKPRRAQNISSVERFWWEACTVTLGAMYLYVSFVGTSEWDLTRIFGIVGGVLLIGSIAFHNTWIIILSALIGTVPLAILDWWSVVAPVLAFGAVLIAFLRIRRIRESD